MFLLCLFWASHFFPFLFLCLSRVHLLSSFIPVFSFLFLVRAFYFCFVCFLVQDAILFFLFLLVVLFCFESSCLISFCFASCSLVVVVAFWFLLLWYFVIFEFLATYQKTSLNNIGNYKKKQTWKMQKKRTLCTRAVSTGVLTNSVFFLFCVSLNFALFAENTIKIGVSAKTKETQHKKKQKKPSVKNWSKLALKTGPSMLRNKIGPVFNARNVVFFLFLFLLCFILFFPQGEWDFQKQQKNKKFDQFLTLEKATIGAVFNSTAYIYIYIYMCYAKT